MVAGMDDGPNDGRAEGSVLRWRWSDPDRWIGSPEELEQRRQADQGFAFSRGIRDSVERRIYGAAPGSDGAVPSEGAGLPRRRPGAHWRIPGEPDGWAPVRFTPDGQARPDGSERHPAGRGIPAQVGWAEPPGCPDCGGPGQWIYGRTAEWLDGAPGWTATPGRCRACGGRGHGVSAGRALRSAWWSVRIAGGHGLRWGAERVGWPVVAAAVDVVQGVVPYVTRWSFAWWLVRQVALRGLPVRGAWAQWTNNPGQDAHGRRTQRFRFAQPPPVPRVGESADEWVERVVQLSERVVDTPVRQGTRMVGRRDRTSRRGHDGR